LIVLTAVGVILLPILGISLGLIVLMIAPVVGLAWTIIYVVHLRGKAVGRGEEGTKEAGR
jgi:hypothetical protein